MSLEVDVDAAAAEQILERKLTFVERFFGTATREASKVVERELKSRIQRPRYAQNIQDAPTRALPSKAPVKISFSGSDGIISVGQTVAAARSPVVSALFRQLGLEKELRRTGLWTDLDRRRSAPSEGYTTRSGLTFVPFSARPGLRDWAERPDKGTQMLRHTIVLVDPRVRLKLIVAPAVSHSKNAVLKLFLEATEKGLAQ